LIVDVQTQIVIERPVSEVAGFAGNPERAPEWYANIQSAVVKTPLPLRIGSQIAFTAQFLGRKLMYTYEIVELVAEAKLVMRTAGGPFPMETSYSWEAVSPQCCRMTLRNHGKPRGFALWIRPLMSFAMRRANRKDLARLKSILECKDGHSNRTANRRLL
jgi:Polyketide cyclase / dehydrase and lipid transport